MMLRTILFSIFSLPFLLNAQWDSPLQEIMPRPMDHQEGLAKIKFIPDASSEDTENYQIYTFDEKGRMLSRERYKEGALHLKQTRTYNEAGLLASEEKQRQRKAGMETQMLHFIYEDSSKRLLREEGREQEEKTYETVYEYDEEGRLLTKMTYHYDGFDEDIPSTKVVYEYSEDGRTVTYLNYMHNPASFEEDPFYITRKEIRHYASKEHEQILKWTAYTGGIDEKPLKLSHQYVFEYNDQEKIGAVKVLNDKGELSETFPGDVSLQLSYDRAGEVTKIESYAPVTEELRRSTSISYDSKGNVSSIKVDEVNGPEQELRISYDGQGNWTHAVRFKDGERVSTQKRILEYY